MEGSSVSALTVDSDGLLSLVPTTKPTRRLARRTRKIPRPLVEAVILAIPLLLVSMIAVMGQEQWAAQYATGGDQVWAWLLALALESMGVYTAWEAHAALLAGDTAVRLRLGSYGIGAVVGALNYWDHSTSGHPSAAAIAFGLMSASAPWLWAIRSRSLHRAQLKAAGLIEARSVRFPAARWLWWPRLTFHVYREAIRAGETDPRRAMERWGTPTVTDTTPEDRGAADTPAPTTAEPVQPATIEAVPPLEAAPRRTPRSQRPVNRPSTVTGRRIATYLAEHPGAKQTDVAEAIGVSLKTVQRSLTRLAREATP